MIQNNKQLEIIELIKALREKESKLNSFAEHHYDDLDEYYHDEFTDLDKDIYCIQMDSLMDDMKEIVDLASGDENTVSCLSLIEEDIHC